MKDRRPSARPGEPGGPPGAVVARLDGVGKTYDPARGPVLRGIDLEIRRGDLVSIVGASGSGKTTLLNILGCIDRPSGGRYEIHGERVDNLDQERLGEVRCHELGYIFQHYHLIDHLTVQENLSVRFLYGGGPVPSRFRAQIREALDELGIADLADRYPRNLSGGEMQRVAIARALVRRPALVLADEPTGNLDAANAATLMDLLAVAVAGGTAVVLVTHNEAMAALCGHRYHLDGGRLLDAA